MEIKNNFIAIAALVAGLGVSTSVFAANISMNMAKMQALDKVTGKMNVINVPVNGEVKFGSFSVIVRSCQTTPPEETPEDYAFVDVADTNREGKTYNIFKGWMVSSSPSLNSVEHPIYDVWLLKCFNSQINSSMLLSDQQLEERDNLKKLKDEDISKEAQKAIEFQKQNVEKEEVAKLKQAEEDKKLEEIQENKERQQALDDELQTSIEAAVSDASNNALQGDGPISLLNMGHSENPPAPQKDKVSAPQVEESATENSLSEDVNINEVVVIEDTHHETVEDLQLPPDIEDIMPQPKN